MNTKKILLLIALAAVIVFGILYFFKNNKNITDVNSPAQVRDFSSGNLEPKIDTQGTVTVKVTPLELLPKTTEWKFDVVLDTHSLELGQDMTKVAVLIDDKNNEYEPVAWEGSGSGGHHREGVLVFNAIDPMSVYVKLKIKDIGNIPERLFKWDIK